MSSDELSSDTDHPWFSALVVVVLALLVRGGVLLAAKDTLQLDPDGYRAIAETLRQTGVYGYRGADGAARPTAYRPPLYPWLLSLTAASGQVSAVAVAALHLALGAATVGVVLVLARLWGAPRWGPLAAVLTAADPILLNQSALVMSETLAVFLSAAALLCLSRLGDKQTLGSAALAGAALALAALCRTSLLAWLAVVAASVFLWGRQGRRLALVGVLLAAAAAVLAPWTLRNYSHCGRLIATTTHGGYTLLLGNNPSFYRHLRERPTSGVWDASQLQQQLAARISQRRSEPNVDALEREVAKDKEAYEMAWESIHSEPATFARACAARLANFWGALPRQLSADEPPSRQVARRLTALWYWLCFVLAAVGASTKGRDLGRRPWLWGVALCFSLTVVHAVYWSNLRMRAPLTPVICLLAALGVSQLRQAVVVSRRWASGGREHRRQNPPSDEGP